MTIMILMDNHHHPSPTLPPQFIGCLILSRHPSMLTKYTNGHCHPYFLGKEVRGLKGYTNLPKIT
jgi:hypothetical protein